MQRAFNRLYGQKFDLLICGGGIYGAWTAYDAALRGLTTAIVDKSDWAAGTSSASSKLIHGGLRYLETFDFKLVKKTLAERDMLLQAAPHRVWPLRFGIPSFKGSRLGKLQLKAGLSLYDFLANTLPASQKHRQYSKADFIGHFPFLDPTLLTGGFSYFDAQTDDARLTLELINGAYSAGATCVNYCEVKNFIEENGRIVGAVLQDNVTNEILEVSTRFAVDTAGRWSSLLSQKNDSCRLTKGIHLIMPGILKDEALLLTAKSDGRVFFMIPWYNRTLLGTTDTNYDGDIENVDISTKDIRYLLNEANYVLRTTQWTEQDIIGKFAGLRVLKQSHLSNPSNISRDWSFQIAPNGLLSSIGGKITSAREDAAEIVDTVCGYLEVNQPCQTFGKPFPWIGDTDYRILQKESLHTAKALGIDDESANWLLKRHGTRIQDIFKLCEENRQLITRIKPDLPLILADIVFCSRNEMSVHLDDVLRRRLPLMILANLSETDLSRLAGIVAENLGWDAEKTKMEIKNACNNNSLD